nr:unnamed protein product [Callosobruchus chinensis]
MMRSQTVDERTQTAACLSEGSPRKKKLRKTVKQLRNEVDYLKKKTTSLKRNQECKSLPKVTLGEYKQLTYKFCPSVELAKFINVQISQITKKPRGRRYSPSFKNTCLSLYFEGPKLYRKKLTKMFCLPSFTTLSRFIKHVKISPGVDDNVFSYLEKKVAHFSPLDKNCIVCIDEILAMSEHSNPLMNATVVMIRGLCKNWKQPLSYVLVNSVCPARKLEQLLKKNIERLQCIGLNVLAVVCDMGSNNIKLSENLQITAERPFFVCGNKEVAFIFDAPHLLKALRNNLLKYDFFLDGNLISWRFIEQFYNHDKQYPIRGAPALTDSHISPNNFEKMKVKYAAQVFSSTVAACINLYVRFNHLPKEAQPTEEFIRKINNIFDFLNTSSKTGRTEHQNAFAFTDNQQQFLENSVEMFQRLEVVDVRGNNITPSIKCLAGWKITLKGMLKLGELAESGEMEFLLTRTVWRIFSAQYGNRVATASIQPPFNL